MAQDDSKPGPLRRLADKAVAFVSKVKETAQLDFFARFKEPDSSREIDLPVDVGHDTMWATQAKMAELFGRDTDTIGEHIRNVYADGEPRGNYREIPGSSGGGWTASHS